jgi:hypothetical protein
MEWVQSKKKKEANLKSLDKYFVEIFFFNQLWILGYSILPPL